MSSELCNTCGRFFDPREQDHAYYGPEYSTCESCVDDEYERLEEQNGCNHQNQEDENHAGDS